VALIILSIALSAGISTKSYLGDSLVKSASGITYLDNEHNIFIEIERPLHQVFFFRADTLILYYPEDRKAFFFSHYNPMNLSVTQVFLGTQKNQDLTPYGFRFISREMIGDTTNTYWVIEKDKSGIRFHFRYYSGRLVQISLEKDDSILARTIYRNYTSNKSIRIPREILSFSYISRPQTKEILALSDIKILPSFPDSLKDIKIPEGVEVKKW